MAISQENLIQRIDHLMDLGRQYDHNSEYGDGCRVKAELTYATLHLLESIYGSQSQKCQTFRKEIENARDNYSVIRASSGVLDTIKEELLSGLVGSLNLQAQGGVFGDFITLARQSLDESKDVAAVLVSAALEDTLKRFALQNGLNVADADMPEVINALKSKGLLKGPQASVVQSYVQLRNKAFHAEWDKIEKETVNSAISFTETFLLEHFS